MHSLGQVAVGEHMCLCGQSAVESPLTLGSPLGLPSEVFDRSTPDPTAGTGTSLGSVVGGLNVANPDDMVASLKDIAPLLSGHSRTMPSAIALWATGTGRMIFIDTFDARETSSAFSDVLN
jgi:hypothetical protein